MKCQERKDPQAIPDYYNSTEGLRRSEGGETRSGNQGAEERGQVKDIGDEKKYRRMKGIRGGKGKVDDGKKSGGSR